jgi:hypothetical protein
MLNLSALFHTSDDNQPSLLSSLDLTTDLQAYLSQARVDIRNCLRDGIPRALKEAGIDKAPEPRFFTQGSWAYKTLNAPAQEPQQADLDDGCYLPLSFVKLSKRPSQATDIFFKAAEACLAVLCAARRWKMREKPTCIRIEVSQEAHIDVPLYAIPDDQFLTLRKAFLAAFADSAMDEDTIRRAERDSWARLPSDVVLLAHREHGWWESDPRPVKDWFEAQVAARGGDQVRRVVRYLKAFRDWKWPEGGPASILLMAAAVPLFERRLQRDDLALLDVLAKLPAVLRAGVCNPVDEKESLTKRLGPEKTEEAARAYEQLERVLRACVHASSENQVCYWLRNEFGERFPMRPDRVKNTSVAETVAAAPAVAAASELVGRSKAG